MRTYPHFEDLGIVDDDHTENMRKAPAVTEALRIDQPCSHHNHQGDLHTMMTQITACKHCTAPTTGADTCTFCATYVPPESPAQRLDVAANRVDLLRHDINAVVQDLPTDAPLFAVADVVTALGHLRQAAVLLDRANDVLEADAKAVR